MQGLGLSIGQRNRVKRWAAQCPTVPSQAEAAEADRASVPSARPGSPRAPGAAAATTALFRDSQLREEWETLLRGKKPRYSLLDPSANHLERGEMLMQRGRDPTAALTASMHWSTQREIKAKATEKLGQTTGMHSIEPALRKEGVACVRACVCACVRAPACTPPENRGSPRNGETDG